MKDFYFLSLFQSVAAFFLVVDVVTVVVVIAVVAVTVVVVHALHTHRIKSNSRSYCI